MLDKRKLLRGLIVPSVFAAAVVAAAAYTLIPVKLEQMAREAEIVVVGHVAGLESRFNDEGTMILTRTTIEVEEAIVGDVPETLQITEYGGRVGDRRMVSPAQVSYRQGEHVLVFVCRDALGLMRTCGAHQGRLSVYPAADGTTEAVGVMAGEEIRSSLSDLRARVRGALGRTK